MSNILGSEAVVFAWEDDAGREGTGFRGRHLCIGHDNDGVTHLYLASCSAIETNATAVAWTCDDVRVETFAIHVVDNMDALACEEVGGIHEVLVNGDTAHIMEVGLRDGGTVNLTFQDF